MIDKPNTYTNPRNHQTRSKPRAVPSNGATSVEFQRNRRRRKTSDSYGRCSSLRIPGQVAQLRGLCTTCARWSKVWSFLVSVPSSPPLPLYPFRCHRLLFEPELNRVAIQPKQVNISTLWTQVMGAFALRDKRMEARRDISLSRPFLIFSTSCSLRYLPSSLIYHLYLKVYSPVRISGRTLTAPDLAIGVCVCHIFCYLLV